MAARDHPLAKRHRLHVIDLCDYPAILPAASTYTRQITERALAPFEMKPRIGLSTNYLETIKMLVSVGLGWSILPRTLLDKHIEVLPVAGLNLQRTLGVVQHRERTLSNAATALLKLLQNSGS